MQALFEELKALFQSFHKWTKRLLHIGLPIALFCLFAAGCFYYIAAFSEEYYKMLRLAEDFFICGRDFLSITLIFALSFEALQKKIALEEQKNKDS